MFWGFAFYFWLLVFFRFYCFGFMKSAILALSVIALFMGSCGHIPRALWYNLPSVQDKGQEIRIPASGEPCNYETEQKPLDEPRKWLWTQKKKMPRFSEEALKKSGTDAFVIVKGDSLVFEYYGKKYNRTSRFNTHSVAKVLVSTLAGVALKEGKIRSLDQPVTDFLPELKGKVSPELKVRDLLQMTSGLNFSEFYFNPFSSVTRMYYGRHTERFMKHIRQRTAPGEQFAYRSSNTWLMARVLEKATGVSLATYTHEKLWEPLCVPAEAALRTDRKNGTILGFAGFNTSAIGLARLGQLYTHGGVWKGTRILPPNWTLSMFNSDTLRGAVPFYRLGWFTDSYYKDYFAEGIFYQYLYCHPSSQTVVVRIGDGANDTYDWRMSFRVLAGVQVMPSPQEFNQGERFNLSGIYEFGKRSDGDTSLTGRRVKIIGKENYLSVKVLRDPAAIRHLTKEYKTDKCFRVYKESDNRFYEPETYRTFEFSSDSEKITWNRKENSWVLEKRRRL